MIFTTSWDDGDARDLRVAEMLTRYGMTGTFYVGQNQRGRLSEDEIRTLAIPHEVGAHGLTHRDLTTLTREEKRTEIVGSKTWLEGVLGKPIEMFCYPYGRFDEETKQVVTETGFLGARSSVKTLGTIPTDRFSLPVTMMTYREPFGLAEKMRFRFVREKLANTTWEKRVRDKFASVHAAQGVFHLWGHSWEIDDLALWDSLDAFLAWVASHEHVAYMTNAALVRSV